MQQPTELRSKLPGRAPKKHRWYYPENFAPWRIDEDPGYKSLSPKGKEIYHELCRHSHLTKKEPRRRYVECTYEQLAQWASCSKRFVVETMKKILRARLAIRWFKGCTQYGASRYELPVSINQIFYWRINLKKQR